MFGIFVTKMLLQVYLKYVWECNWQQIKSVYFSKCLANTYENKEIKKMCVCFRGQINPNTIYKHIKSKC